jgi:hypothetical protein
VGSALLLNQRPSRCSCGERKARVVREGLASTKLPEELSVIDTPHVLSVYAIPEVTPIQPQIVMTACRLTARSPESVLRGC